jgi:hypothetical protein
VTFSDDRVRAVVDQNFERAWTNIRPDLEYRPGIYTSYPTDSVRKNFPNGGGSENVGTLFAAPDGKVLHLLPGCWDPEIYREEVDFVLRLRDAMLDTHGRLKDSGAFERLHREQAERWTARGHATLANIHEVRARQGLRHVESFALGPEVCRVP